jgi:hypothetical protein
MKKDHVYRYANHIPEASEGRLMTKEEAKERVLKMNKKDDLGFAKEFWRLIIYIKDRETRIWFDDTFREEAQRFREFSLSFWPSNKSELFTLVNAWSAEFREEEKG